MATEAEVKAQERRELLNDIIRRRAAAAQAEGSVRAAEEGQYGDVGQGGPKGEFDDEINQDPENKMSYFDFLKNYFTDPRLSVTGAGIDLLGRLGATTAPITQKPLETISQGGDNIVQKAGKFLFEDAAKVAAKINSGVSFDELTPGEKFAIASVPAEAIPGLGLAPDILKLAKNFVVNAGKSTLKAIDNITQPVGITNEGIMMPMVKTGDQGSNVVNKLPQQEVKVRGDGKPDLSKMETVGEDGKIYVNINGKAILKDDVILNTSVDSSGRTRYTYSFKSGVGKSLNPKQDNFLLKVIKKRLDEGQAFNTVRGSLNNYISENPNLLKEAEELNILNFSDNKLQDRLSKILNNQILFRKGQTEETNNLIEEILKFKPLKKEGSAFLSYLRGNKTIDNIISADKNIDKTSLTRYLDFIRKSSPKTKRPVEGKFENFMDDFKLEIKDLKNTDSIFYKQYEYFKQFDKVRDEAGKKIKPFLNKIFPSTTDEATRNSVQIAHRFENTQIADTVGEGLAGTGGTPSAYYLDISRFNSEIQPKIEAQIRKALADGDTATLNKLNTQLTDEVGAEIIIDGVKFGKHTNIEEKLLKLAQKYESNPKLMKEDGVTLEMMRNLYEGIDIISKGASDLGIAMMAKGGLVGISHLTRPLGNF